MSLHKRALLALAACGVVIGMVAFLSRDTEPSYHGKTLKQWMNQYCWPHNPTATDLHPRKVFFEDLESRQKEAADAVQHIGTNAIPALLDWADKEVSVAWKHKLLTTLPKRLQNWHPVGWWLVGRDHYRADRALRGFYILGSNAIPAVPELTHRMMTRSSDSGRIAALALANMGAAGLPALLSALTNTQAANRVMIVRSAANATRAASNDVSGILVLAQCVRDTDASVGAAAAMELGFITTRPDLTVSALADGLKVSAGQVRARSADALGNYGARARSAVPVLLLYQNDPDPFVRECVTRALQQLVFETLETNRVPTGSP